MKNLFASMIIVLVVLFSSFTVRANSTAMLEDDSLLTIENIESSLWEELINKSQNIKTSEDRYVSLLINGINETQKSPDGSRYICRSICRMDVHEINCDRLMKKFKKIIRKYNLSHDLKLKITHEVVSEHLNIYINSTNHDELSKNPILYIGQQARLEFGSIYWESSQNFGSGKAGIASHNNNYLNDDLIVSVIGVSYLDKNGDIIRSFYKCKHKINIAKNYMLLISVNDTDLGWTHPKNLTKLE